MSREKFDHTTIRPGGPPRSSDTAPDRLWWKKTGQAAADAVTTCLKNLEDQEQQRARQLVRSMRLFGNMPVFGSGAVGPQNIQAVMGTQPDRISLNICQSVTETVVSKIGKNKPRPYFVTSAGNSEQQAKAKKRNKFLDGLFYENGAYKLGRKAFRHACVLGAGVIKVYPENGTVAYSLNTCDEIKVDEMEAANGDPRQLHHVRPVDREVLKQAFSKHAALIESADAFTREIPSSRATISDMVLVRESWHLPSGPDADDGKHMISIAEGVLLGPENWTHEFFPFAFLPWGERIKGFWPQGLVEQIQPLQLEINKLLYLVQRSYQLGGSYKILMEMGSKISPEHFNALVGAVVQYQGAKPEYIVPPLVPAEIYAHMRWLVDQAYEQSGVNKLSSAGEVPVGMEKASGKALRTMNDIQSDRFQDVGQAYEQFFMDLGRISLAVAHDMFERGDAKKFSVRVPGSRLIERLEMKDSDLKDDDAFVMQMFPISSLSQEPAQRLADAQDMSQAGVLSPRQFKRILNFPDIEAETTLDGATEDYLLQSLDRITAGDFDESADGYPTPESTDNPALGYELAQQYYTLGKRDNLPEQRLELLRNYMIQCEGLIQAAQPPPMAPAPSGPAGASPPQAVPAAPPVSDALPNAPGAQA